MSADGSRLLAPLVYATEIARSVRLGSVRSRLPSADPAVSTEPAADDLKRFRLCLGSDRKELSANPRLDLAKVVTGLDYGLVNVRTEGKRILFAIREERGNGWGIETIEEDEIARAAVLAL